MAKSIKPPSLAIDIPHTNYTNVSFEAFNPSDEKFAFDELWILDQRTFSTNSDKNIAIMEALLHADILVFIKDDKAPPQSILEHFGLNGYEFQTGGSTNQIGYYLWSENNETRMGKLYARISCGRITRDDGRST